MRTALFLAALGLATTAVAQIPVPAFGTTYTGAQTRGFWFQAPANFIITGLSVPNETLQPFQVVEVIDLGLAAPPAFPTTIVGTQLYYDNASVGGSIIPTVIPCVAGNYYGILGACTPTVGSATSYNSYAGVTGAFTSNILGLPTTLTRFGTQFGIGAGGNQACWSEIGGTFCRVDVYVAPSGGGTIATNTTVGLGCVNVPDVSSYENFLSSAAFDLGNTSFTLIHTGSGYLAVQNVVTYLAPSPTAAVLTLTDDSETTVTLSQAMPVGSSGSTNALTVCSNGFISPAVGNGVSYTPTAAAFLTSPRTWWSLCWHDYNPAIAGSGQVKYEQIGNIAYITWDGVWDYGGATAANANTFQAQFDVTNGSVSYVYQTMSTLGNGRLTGFSDAGASVDPGSMDISAALPSFAAATFAVVPLSLTATSRPVTNTSWNLSVNNVPAASVGVDIFGVSDPGILDLSLFGLGQPGCQLRASLDIIQGPWFGAGNHTYSLSLPNSPALVSFHVFTQSAVLSLANFANNLTSNGIDGRIGDL